MAQGGGEFEVGDAQAFCWLARIISWQILKAAVTL
jgi:hypothetical protein